MNKDTKENGKKNGKASTWNFQGSFLPLFLSRDGGWRVGTAGGEWKSGKFDLLGFFLAHAHVSSPFSIRGDGTQGEVRSHGSHAANAQNDLSVHGATQFIKQLTLAANVVLYVVEAEMENNL
jgi:hypothetical protein